MSRENKRPRPRKRPAQSRSKQTVEWLLEATIRVFRTEGVDATTNRIAAAAGVSVGTLYEYFPNKDALLFELAERHVELAERGIEAAIASAHAIPEWLAEIQAAIVASHRYPSQALTLVVDDRAPELRARAARLHALVFKALLDRVRSAGLTDAELRARTVLGLIGEQSSLAIHERGAAGEREAMLRHLLALATQHLQA